MSLCRLQEQVASRRFAGSVVDVDDHGCRVLVMNRLLYYPSIRNIINFITPQSLAGWYLRGFGLSVFCAVRHAKEALCTGPLSFRGSCRHAVVACMRRRRVSVGHGLAGCGTACAASRKEMIQALPVEQFTGALFRGDRAFRFSRRSFRKTLRQQAAGHRRYL